MNIRERAMSALRREEPDRIPLLIYSGLLPRGSVERQLRNKDLGLEDTVRVYGAESPNVRVERKTAGGFLSTTYHTPLGSVSEKQRTGLKEGTGGAWTTEHLIKDVSDYEIIMSIFEDTSYHPDYENFHSRLRDLGDDGIVRAGIDRSPLQKMMLELMGFKTFSVHLHRYPKEFDELFRVIQKKIDEQYQIVAESPAEVVLSYENVTGVMTNPKLFEKYCVGFYKRQARLFHKNDKIYGVHFDGILNCLKGLIRDIDVDVIEAFTPPPVGDLSISEARTVWNNRYVIAINFPDTIFRMGPDDVRKTTMSLMKDATPGDRFLITFTEDIPADVRGTGLMIIADTVLKYGSYPISIKE